MSQENVFIPKAYQANHNPKPSSPNEEQRKNDKVGNMLLTVARTAVVVAALAIPLFFTPGLYASLSFDKFLIALAAGLVVLISLTLASLRFRSARSVAPIALGLFWAFVAGTLISASLSGDVQDSIRGSVFGVQTFGFVALMGLLMTITLVLQRSKKICLYVLAAFSLSAFLIIGYNVVRFIAGPILPLGSFGSLTVSPVGGLNDLAVFSAITLVLSLITLLQLPLKRWMKAFLAILSFGSLAVLMVANFFYLWIVVGLLSLLFLIYLLSRDILFNSDELDSEESNSNPNYLLLGLTLVVCLVSAFFVVAGDFAGAQINSLTGVNYIEVRPSLEATLDMAQSVYQEDIILGVGPNRFSDAWRQHKDLSINQTNFWDVDFSSGFGLVSTIFVTTGILGGLLLVAFHLTLLYMGYRMLMQNETKDPFWYYFGSATFLAAVLLWGITYVYVPGATVLLLTALFTGLTFVAYGALVPSKMITFPLTINRRSGFFYMALAVLIVVVSVVLTFIIAKQYVAESNYSRALTKSESIEEFEVTVQDSYNLYSDKRFLVDLARYRVSTLQQILTIQEPTEEDQKNFSTTAEQAIVLSQRIIEEDPTDPMGYVLLANTYYILATTGLEGAQERADSTLATARELAPKNPSYPLIAAFGAVRTQDYQTAKTEIQNSLKLKSNYADALFLLSQLQIQEGNVESAIESTRQIVTLDPNNPTRYYQLGILLASNDQVEEAIEAYKVAIALNDEFANARYMLAMALVAQEQPELALEQLRIIQEDNQDNEQLAALIVEIETTGTIASVNTDLETPVTENEGGEASEDGVVTNEVPDTDVVSPVNTEPSAETEE